MIFPTRALAHLGATALLAIGGVAAAGAPAYADPATADVSVTGASSKIAVGVPGKDFRFDVKNAGPGVATDTTLELNWSGLDDTLVDVDPAQFDGCTVSGETAVCELGDGAVGETLPGLIGIQRIGGTTGKAGSFTVTAKSSTPDPDETNNSDTIDVEVVESGADLLAVALDVYAINGEDDFGPVAPGGTAPLFWFLANQGDQPAKGISLAISLPEHVSFVEDLDGCAPAAGKRVLTCEFADAVIEPGDAIFPVDEGMMVKVSEDAPGPVTLTGGVVKGSAIASVDPTLARAKVVSAAPDGLQVKETEKLLKDIDEGDNNASFSVFVGATDGDNGNGGGGDGGGLPVTGVQAGLIGGIGLAVVAAGGVLFLLGRRRRIVLVAPDAATSTD